MRTPSIFKRKKGLTLIELLVALVISAIVIAAIYRLFIVQTRAYTVQDQAVEVQQSVRSAMEILLRDLRMAGYDDDSVASTVTIPTPLVTPLADNSIRVNYEYFDATAAQYRRHTVQYRVDGTTLNRQIDRNPPNDSVTEPLLENVVTLAFTYGVDADGDGSMDDRNGDNIIDDNDWVNAATVNAGNLKVIAVRVTLTGRPDQTNPDVRARVSPRTLTSAITFRNLLMK